MLYFFYRHTGYKTSSADEQSKIPKTSPNRVNVLILTDRNGYVRYENEYKTITRTSYQISVSSIEIPSTMWL